ncbi:MAG TPA: hypothetical protein VFK22_04010 [Candidatus Dormibacteraeota bacterium]|nr:hypothetical protein [Candidatus Dormibacteraeota bacterium]
MNDTQRLETELTGVDGPPAQDQRLAEWSAELEHRIELLEEDITLLFKAAGLAGLREQELLLKLGLPDDTLQRHHSELLAQASLPQRDR